MRALGALNGASIEDHVVGERRTDEPGQADRAAVNKAPPPPAIHAERGVLGGSSQMHTASSSPPATAGPSTAAMTAERSRRVSPSDRDGAVDPVAVPGRDRLEVSACTGHAVAPVRIATDSDRPPRRR